MSRQLPLDLSLKDRPSFANFWPGENHTALEAARAVAAGGYGPLYLFGPAGSGKTHLLAAIAREVQAREPCAFVSLAEARTGEWWGLEDLAPDTVVCIDGVDAVAGDPAGEARLFVLLEALAPARRLVLAGRSNPAGLGIVRADVRTRLASGPVIAMRRLSDEARRHALQHRARLRGLVLTEGASLYLLAHGPRDLKALFALLDELDQATLADQRRLTVPYVRAALARRSMERGLP